MTRYFEHFIYLKFFHGNIFLLQILALSIKNSLLNEHTNSYKQI